MGSRHPPAAGRSASPGRRRPAAPWGRLGLLVALASLAFGLPTEATRHDPECARWRAAFLDMPVRTVVLGTAAGPGVRITVRLAATEEARRAGFQCATPEEIDETAILFDFGAEVMRGVHMWNVPAPLDIAFAKASGRIFSILRMEPGARESYGPMGRFRYALEARADFFNERGVSLGDALSLEPAR